MWATADTNTFSGRTTIHGHAPASAVSAPFARYGDREDPAWSAHPVRALDGRGRVVAEARSGS
ncbi:hypothetical protein ABT075_13530 [Streptomyces sp. NPDC002677]|uniref:hypothetical protein n=1 Tax=Streptomyces sp. NPDC002677 TaxID=3154774 RepID=UPI0033188A27